MKEVQKLFSKIEFLPPSPSLLPKLLPALADVNANFDQVVDMIELDPGLTAKLLQICNSAFFGAGNPVSDVRQAVNQAGYQAVYLLVAMLNGNECFQSPEVPGLNSKHLWRHSVTTAYGTKIVAESVDLEGGLLFTSGLLHDIGKVVLARARGTEYGLLLIRAAQAHTPAHQAEMTAFGYTHADVGGTLLERWALPAPLVAGVRYHHRPANAPEDSRHIAACVTLGNYLAHAETQPAVLEDPDFKSTLTLLGLDSGEVEHWQSCLVEFREMIDTMAKA
ncbi:MAG TPA: HDOD domain-containing protein [Verrucomicrobiae bacterium]